MGNRDLDGFYPDYYWTGHRMNATTCRLVLSAMGERRGNRISVIRVIDLPPAAQIEEEKDEWYDEYRNWCSLPGRSGYL